MNRKIRFLNLKSLIKRTWRCHVFYLNYGEVRKRRSFVLGFLLYTILCFTDEAVIFFSLLSDCHSSLFCKESVISVFYPRLPKSFDQNTKQNKTPCVRVSSKNKENICLQSHLSLFFLLKKCFRCLLKSGVTEIEFKDRDFWCGKKSASMFYNDAMV